MAKWRLEPSGDNGWHGGGKLSFPESEGWACDGVWLSREEAQTLRDALNDLLLWGRFVEPMEHREDNEY